MIQVLGLPNLESVRKAKQLSGAIAAVRQLNPFRSRTLKIYTWATSQRSRFLT